MKLTLDHHSPRLMLNDYRRPDPPHFSLLSTCSVPKYESRYRYYTCMIEAFNVEAQNVYSRLAIATQNE
jgi:hypothetical protein